MNNNNEWWYHISALIITGGSNGTTLSDVELFIPSTSTNCRLPSLPQATSHHTQDGLLQCRGWGSLQSCHKLVDGTWTLSHTLTERRWDHSSWQRDGGKKIYLMGGWGSPNTTEIVSDSSAVSTPGFSLKYDVMWVVLCLYYYHSLDKVWLLIKYFLPISVNTDMTMINIITAWPAVLLTQIVW